MSAWRGMVSSFMFPRSMLLKHTLQKQYYDNVIWSHKVSSINNRRPLDDNGAKNQSTKKPAKCRYLRYEICQCIRYQSSLTPLNKQRGGEKRLKTSLKHVIRTKSHLRPCCLWADGVDLFSGKMTTSHRRLQDAPMIKWFQWRSERERKVCVLIIME